MATRSNKGKLRPQHRRSRTPEQEEFIRYWYKRMGLEDLHYFYRAVYGPTITRQQLKSYVTNHKILSGRTGCYEKGNVPANKGTKGLTGARSTSFKKGSVPANKHELGSERITVDGYIEIKIPEPNPYTQAATRFKLKHIWLWEGVHGKVPKGKILVFKDGDQANLNLDNLLLVTRNEQLLMNLHDYKNAPAEVKPSILALVKVEAKAGIRASKHVGGRRKKNENVSV